MARKKSAALLDELNRFLLIAEEIANTSATYRQIGKKLDLQPSAVQECLDKLEQRYRVTLIDRADRSAGENRLTAEGQQLRQQILEWISWQPMSPPRVLKMAITHSLISCDVLRPVIAQLNLKNDPSFDITLRLRTRLVLSQIFNDLYSREVDFAVIWDIEQRKRLPPRITAEEIGPMFDLVLISHSPSMLQELSVTAGVVDLDGAKSQDILAGKRLVVMGPENQPLMDQLPGSNYDQGGQRVEVDTIDAVVACVRNRIADFGLVPAIYPELDRYRQQGHLYYLPTGNSIRLNVLTRSPGRKQLPPVAKDFVDELHRYLSTKFSTLNLPSFGRELKSLGFPRTPGFFQKLKFGYYIEQNRSVAPRWHWQRVELSLGEKATGRKMEFDGRIENSSGDTYDIDAYLHEEIFVVNANRSDADSDKSVSHFVSVFPWCSVEEGIIFGNWTGIDLAKRPSVYATLWSHAPLSAEALMRYSQRHMLQHSFNSDEAINFEHQPQSPVRVAFSKAAKR